MPTLTLSTCMAPNMDFLTRELAGYLGQRLGMPARAVLDIPWQAREQAFDAGEIDLLWLCGLPYVRKAGLPGSKITPVLAPVMSAPRYGDRPVYFSDVVVGADSPFMCLEDLRGCRWAYNEPGSHSGYGVVRYELARRGLGLDLFGQWLETGAHQVSLECLLARQVDASAVDSTVLELEIARRPEIAARLRVIDTFGPSPSPPWVTGGTLDPGLRGEIVGLLSSLHRDPAGQAILDKARMARLQPVNDRDYDPIRAMARAGGLLLESSHDH